MSRAPRASKVAWDRREASQSGLGEEERFVDNHEGDVSGGVGEAPDALLGEAEVYHGQAEEEFECGEGQVGGQLAAEAVCVDGRGGEGPGIQVVEQRGRTCRPGGVGAGWAPFGLI